MPENDVFTPDRRSIGEFLCRHPSRPLVEFLDRLPNLDVRQDAALRAFVALRRLGKPVGDDPIAAFNAEPRLARLAYRWAYRDALRRRRPLGRRRPVASHDWNWSGLHLQPLDLDHLGTLHDPSSDDALASGEMGSPA